MLRGGSASPDSSPVGDTLPLFYLVAALRVSGKNTDTRVTRAHLRYVLLNASQLLLDVLLQHPAHYVPARKMRAD